MKPPITLRVILDYEIRSSWWARWVGWAPLQDLAGSWFAWKSKRKWDRWQQSLKDAEMVQAWRATE